MASSSERRRQCFCGGHSLDWPALLARDEEKRADLKIGHYKNEEAEPQDLASYLLNGDTHPLSSRTIRGADND